MVIEPKAHPRAVKADEHRGFARCRSGGGGGNGTYRGNASMEAYPAISKELCLQLQDVTGHVIPNHP
jgi:hypothetical protein